MGGKSRAGRGCGDEGLVEGRPGVVDGRAGGERTRGGTGGGDVGEVEGEVTL